MILEEDQEIVRAIFREARDAFFIVEPQTLSILEVNPAAQRLTGLRRKQLMESSIEKLFESSKPKGLEDIVLACQRTTYLMARDAYFLKQQSGESIPVHVTISRVHIEPHPVALMVVRDATEWKRAEEKLREAQRFHEQIIASAREGIVVLDGEFRYQLWNPYLEELTGLSAANVIGKSPWQVAPFLGLRMLESLLQQAIGGTIVEIPEAAYPSVRTGRLGWTTSRFGPLRGSGNQIIGILGTVHDITDRKRAEEELRSTHQMLSTVLDHIPQGVFWKDRESRYLGCNQLVATAFGLGVPPAIVGLTDSDLPTLTPEQADFFVRKDREVMETNTPQLGIVETATLPGGKIIWMETSKMPLHDDAGKVVGILGTWQDITERKRGEEERRRLESQMQHAQKLESLGILAGGIAHDFNNLLTSILGFSDLARMDLPPGQTREFIDEVVKGARQAADLTQQMLAYSGKGRFVSVPLDLSSLIQETRLLLEVSISKKCTVNYRLGQNLPAIEADPTQMRQIVMNLIINASESMEDRSGTITLRTDLVHCNRANLAETYFHDSPEGDYVLLEVSDTGCGMSPETLAKIFDPFFSTKFTGRGLGLAAVLGIVRGHGGTIKVSSEPGNGSVFQVFLPPSRKAGVPARPVEHAPVEWRGTGTVLIIDDEPAVQLLAGRMLESVGFTIRMASDGLEGVQIFRDEHDSIRLILLDMTMPTLDGPEAILELRRIRADVPIILSSGYSEQSITERFPGEKPPDFIEKPYRFADLIAAVKKALEIG